MADIKITALTTDAAPSVDDFVLMVDAPGTLPVTKNVTLQSIKTLVTADTLVAAGKAGGQALYGGTASAENLALHSTYHSTKGKIYLETAAAYFDCALMKFVLARTVTGLPADLAAPSGQGAIYESIVYDNSTNATITETFIGGRSIIIATASAGHNTYAWGGAAYQRCNSGMHAGIFGFGYADHADVNGVGSIWGGDFHGVITSAVTANPAGAYGIEVGIHPQKSDMTSICYGIWINNQKNWGGVANYKAGDAIYIEGAKSDDTDGFTNFIKCVRASTESRFVVNASGQIGVNLGASALGAADYLYESYSEGKHGQFINRVYSAGNVPSYEGFRARGTKASPTSVQNTDVLVQLNGRGYKSTGTPGFEYQAAMQCVAEETWSETNRACGFVWYGTPAGGSTTIAEKMRLYGSGVLNTVGGYYVASTAVVGTRKTGWTVATGTAARTTFGTATVTTEELAQRFMALEQDLISHGLIGT